MIAFLWINIGSSLNRDWIEQGYSDPKIENLAYTMILCTTLWIDPGHITLHFTRSQIPVLTDSCSMENEKQKNKDHHMACQLLL